MMDAVSYWPLLGVLVVVVGFALRANPLLVVTLAGVATGLAAALPFTQILRYLGEGFTHTRTLSLILVLPLAVIGLLERNGLREQAGNWIGRFKRISAGRLLALYLLAREVTAALGLTSLGGHPQMVRPLLAPMAEGAAGKAFGPLSHEEQQRLRAMAAATDNVGLFFGEDIFVAFGAVMLMHSFLTENGIDVEPLHIAFWGIPTALCALLIHGSRVLYLDRQLAKGRLRRPR
ncbi:DUF969 domain-containing protein [Gallaecimonas pentaromativorans]|uniref:DUF969 domain-containing protein n=1 Tax=Gallaecimonas pentaromativorans TaxID=584787 RepID=UPI00067ED058|nr:DUF969 domain-containing protein [Gallaecimonas pentaromativorans]MED5524243.1 DUF969 domain-containing protein [Pseudomonadota bacterium]